MASATDISTEASQGGLGNTTSAGCAGVRMQSITPTGTVSGVTGKRRVIKVVEGIVHTSVNAGDQCVDEIFSVDLPTSEERHMIWGIQLSKYGRVPDKFDVQRLVSASEGFTGSEIEVAVIEGLTRAFSENGREPNTDDMLQAVEASTPLSKTAGERISAIRAWGKTRARPATSAVAQAPVRAAGRRVTPDE